MSNIATRSVSVTEEKRIIIGLIVSTEFIRNVEPVLELDYITNKYLERIAGWCLKFYSKHGKAPNKHIKDIYETKAHKIKEAESELIGELLAELSKQYDAEHINVEYLVNSAENYFRKRELEIVSNNIQILNEQGKLKEAEEQIKRYTKVTIALDNSIYINPGNVEQREALYLKKEEKERNFFQLPGDAGIFLGNHKKGDVVGVTAPAKRGKSFLLSNYFNQGVMSRRKVLKWSIEMTDTEELTRMDKSFQPMLSENLNYSKGKYFYPVFDCFLNQTGDCEDRRSKQVVRDPSGELDKENKKHKICTKCRLAEPFRYKVAIWDKQITRDIDNRFIVRKKMEKFLPLLDKYSRIVVRPKYSLTYELMLYDLQQLEYYHNFIPEIIIIDYIDILRIDSVYNDFKLEDEKWRLLQEIAGRTQCLVITATQGNKESYESAIMKSTSQAGFYGKGRHVNLMVGINQTPDEKRQGVWRLAIMDGRDIGVDNEDTCIMLQDLKTGQMHLDSYWPKKFVRRY